MFSGDDNCLGCLYRIGPLTISAEILTPQQGIVSYLITELSEPASVGSLTTTYDSYDCYDSFLVGLKN